MSLGQRPLHVVAWAAALYALFAAAAVALIAWTDGPGAIASRVHGRAPLTDVLWGVAAGLAGVVATGLLARCWAPARRAEATFIALVGPLPTWACVLLAVLSGAGEELLFRAAMQPKIGLVAAAVLFGAVHVPPVRSLWPWPILAAGFGVLMGVLFEFTGAVVAPAAAHATINAVNLVRYAHRARSSDRSAAASGQGQGRPEATSAVGRGSAVDESPKGDTTPSQFTDATRK